MVPPGIRVFSAPPNGTKRSVGIAVSRYNGEITARLLDGALAELDAAGVAPEAIEVMPVPGAFELPLAAWPSRNRAATRASSRSAASSAARPRISIS